MPLCLDSKNFASRPVSSTVLSLSALQGDSSVSYFAQGLVNRGLQDSSAGVPLRVAGQGLQLGLYEPALAGAGSSVPASLS